ncbi:MAG TPA: metal-dependent hydrolase [Solirubrobacteraceae bacterium]|nr:metal-dependent hydrolase [Solirubrobacteraceae bacterium]
MNRRYLVAAADPFAHALLAAAVTAPLGRRAMATAVIAGTAIDVDHPIAARSLRPSAMLTLATRPRSHALLVTAAAGAAGLVAGGPVHGWAAFAGLGSHLLRDASDDAAPTPLLWPVRPPRQIPRAVAASGIAALALGSWAISRRPRPLSRGCAGGAGTAPPRTA